VACVAMEVVSCKPKLIVFDLGACVELLNSRI
jgi:hypothetical protein